MDSLDVDHRAPESAACLDGLLDVLSMLLSGAVDPRSPGGGMEALPRSIGLAEITVIPFY